MVGICSQYASIMRDEHMRLLLLLLLWSTSSQPEKFIKLRKNNASCWSSSSSSVRPCAQVLYAHVRVCAFTSTRELYDDDAHAKTQNPPRDTDVVVVVVVHINAPSLAPYPHMRTRNAKREIKKMCLYNIQPSSAFVVDLDIIHEVVVCVFLSLSHSLTVFPSTHTNTRLMRSGHTPASYVHSMHEANVHVRAHAYLSYLP